MKKKAPTLFKAHPWHGISIGQDAPSTVTAYIEIVPTDTVKFEIDKVSGHLMVDRPQKYSNHCPTLYGFIPQTYCSKGVGALCAKHLGRKSMAGDDDPLDICVLSERPILHGDIMLRAIPIGGLRMIDGDEADDKIIAVLENDNVYGSYSNISEVAPGLIDRLKHYFLTYKEIPGGKGPSKITLSDLYDKRVAHEVIRASRKDYQSSFGK